MEKRAVLTQINFMSVVITCKSNVKIVFRDLCGSRTIGSSSSSNGARRRSRRYPDSPDLGHVLYFSTNGEAYQVYDCNVEGHEDWVKTSGNVDIIYPSGAEGEIRIMYELTKAISILIN